MFLLLNSGGRGQYEEDGRTVSVLRAVSDQQSNQEK